MDINVTGVWERNVTGQGVTVVVVDDGVEHTIKDIQPNYVSSPPPALLVGPKEAHWMEGEVLSPGGGWTVPRLRRAQLSLRWKRPPTPEPCCSVHSGGQQRKCSVRPILTSGAHQAKQGGS